MIPGMDRLFKERNGGHDSVSGKYKTIANGRGTRLEIGQEMYISVGKNGKDVMIRGKKAVAAFPTWEDLVSAINEENTSFYECVGEKL